MGIEGNADEIQYRSLVKNFYCFQNCKINLTFLAVSGTGDRKSDDGLAERFDIVEGKFKCHCNVHTRHRKRSKHK